MTTLFPTLDIEPKTVIGNQSSVIGTAPTDHPITDHRSPLFPAYITRTYICDDDWMYHLVIDRDLKTNVWEVDLAIWSPRWDIRTGPSHGRKPGYRFRRIPCADRPAAEQLALRLESLIQRRLDGRLQRPTRNTAPTPAPLDPDRSLADDF